MIFIYSMRVIHGCNRCGTSNLLQLTKFVPVYLYREFICDNALYFYLLLIRNSQYIYKNGGSLENARMFTQTD